MLMCYRLLLLLLLNCVKANDSPLHIVVAIADDLGWSDVSFQNVSAINTPHIDQLANRGIILTNHYVQPLCSPSRASLLTGKYPIHLGAGLNENVFSPDGDKGLPLTETLLPEKLKELRYKTALFGKWHLGSSKLGYVPTRRGFDRFYGFYSGAIDYYLHNQTAHRCLKLKKEASFLDFRDQEKVVRDRQGEYSAKVFDEEAVKFIKGHNNSQPLFLVMSYQNVHDPLQVPEQYSSMYRHIGDKDRRIYAGMASYLDNSMRLLTDALVNNGFWNNTLLLFLSDNGGNPTSAGYNWPLRGAKGTLWEGGIKSVSFLSGGFLKRTGFKSDSLVHVSDWFPTLLNLARKHSSRVLRSNKPGKVSKNNKTVKRREGSDLDGIDIWKAVSEFGSKSKRKHIVHNINSKSYAVRKGNWKLISELDMGWLQPPEIANGTAHNMTDRPLDPKEFTGHLLDARLPRIQNGLFDISRDISEQHDLSAERPEIVAELFEIVKKYNETIVAHAVNYKCNDDAIEKAKKGNAWGPFSRRTSSISSLL
ncbi:arylsulfatase B-like [Rhopilema esculentum]|uniref:arylsulfatase B-like n=1 Tax=Rhopilema esculentum TaxID=499914 RepID=UPI0031D8EC7D|eukprot:gene2766-988_t